MKLIKITTTNRYYLYFEVINNKGVYEEKSVLLTEQEGDYIKNNLKVVYDVLRYLDSLGKFQGIRNKHSIK